MIELMAKDDKRSLEKVTTAISSASAFAMDVSQLLKKAKSFADRKIFLIKYPKCECEWGLRAARKEELEAKANPCQKCGFSLRWETWDSHDQHSGRVYDTYMKQKDYHRPLRMKVEASIKGEGMIHPVVHRPVYHQPSPTVESVTDEEA